MCIRIWLNLWFSHIPFFQFCGKKLLSSMFSWLKTIDNCLISHANCLFGEIFARGAMSRLPSFYRTCFWSHGRVPDMPPNSKVIVVPFLWIIAEKGSHMLHNISVGWDYLGVVYTLELFILMYQILGYTRYLFYAFSIATKGHLSLQYHSISPPRTA